MANLYDKAGLVNIPVGYQDGFLYNIKPEDNTLGFRFNRDSAATRVNKEGLIEQVGYFGPELIQNGDFSQLGPELVVNGDFATDSDWNKETGWTISEGKLLGTSVTTGLAFQYGVVEAGKWYKASYDAEVISGSIGLFFDGTGYQGLTTTTQTITVLFYATISSPLYLRSDISNFTGSIDNVSVKQVDPNDYWFITDPWAITGLGAYYDDTSGNRLQQSNLNLVANKTYKLTFDIENTTETESYIWIGNAAGTIAYVGTWYQFYSTGSHTVYFTMPSNQTTLAFYGNTTGGPFYINNISLVEILGDKPRIDYTDSLTSPSFLLEPQSTNLITYSEDFSQYTASSISLESGYLAPDGSNNAYKVTGTVGTSALYIGGVNPTSTATRTIYAKTVSGTGQAHLTSYNGNSNNLFTITEDWQRFEVNGTTTAAGESNFYAIDFRGSTNLTEVILWGGQVEELPYATSYIPTSGSTVTRAQETCTGAGNASTFNGSEGVLYAEIAALSDDLTFRLISLSDGTNDNIIKLGYRSESNVIYYEIRSAGSGSAFYTHTVNDITSMNKVAVRFEQNNFSLWINGIKVSNDTNGNTPNNLSNLNFTNFSTSASIFYGKTKGVYVFKEALTDDELQQLTGPEYNSFAALAAAYNYTVI